MQFITIMDFSVGHVFIKVLVLIFRDLFLIHAPNCLHGVDSFTVKEDRMVDEIRVLLDYFFNLVEFTEHETGRSKVDCNLCSPFKSSTFNLAQFIGPTSI